MAQQTDSIDIKLSPAFRIGLLLLVADSVFCLGLLVYDVITNDKSGLYLLSHALAWGSIAALSGWWAYCGWRGPVMHAGPDEIWWRPAVARRTVGMVTSEATGFRWPCPSDLWIEGPGGKTLRLPLLGIARRDRERLRAWLDARWSDGV